MKNRLSHTLIATGAFGVLCVAVASSDADPHMRMTKVRRLQPGDNVRAEAILHAAQNAAERFRDYRKAEADGYAIFMPEQHQNIYHFVRESAAEAGFDPDHPPALLYARTEDPNHRYELVGVMYTAPYDSTEEQLNALIPLSIARWHVHLNMCIPPQPTQRDWLMGDPEFGLNGSITTPEACRAAGGRFLPHLSGWMTHVYPFETDPSKIWAAGMDDHHGMEHSSMPGMKM